MYEKPSCLGSYYSELLEYYVISKLQASCHMFMSPFYRGSILTLKLVQQIICNLIIFIVHTIKNNVAVRINEFLTQENNSQIKAAFRNFSKEKRVL